MNKKAVRKVTLLVCVLGSLSAPITMKPIFIGFGGSHPIIVANGVVDNKRSVDYDCGTYRNRATCTDHYISINGVEHIVSDDTLRNAIIGAEMTISSSKSARSGYWWEWLLAIISIISISVLTPFVLVIFCNWLFWLLISDTELSYKEWMKR